jgi:pilus assembly protein Flp/PilA
VAAVFGSGTVGKGECCVKKVLRRTWRILRRDNGASAVEYGLLVALIAVVIAGTVAFLGTTLTDKFQQACNQVGSQDGCNGGEGPPPKQPPRNNH